MLTSAVCRLSLRRSLSMVAFTQTVNGVTGAAEWSPVGDDYDYHQEISRSGFADMLHDFERNDKYRAALKAAIDEMHRRGRRAHVLDIGTGTGLLSMMAAQCGADSIVACEAFRPMAECAVKIIESNGYGDVIRVIPKRSTELTVGADGDIPIRPNILVTEVFDTELIGEGAIETFRHAHRELLDPDCIVVPDSSTVYVQVMECSFLQKWNKLDDVHLQDDTFVRIPPEIQKCPGSAAVHDLQLSELPHASFEPISEPMAVFHFDWSGKKELVNRETQRTPIKSLTTGNAQMVFLWWDLKMDFEGKIILSCAPWWNHPDADKKCKHPQNTIPWRDHWMQAVYYFSQSVPLNRNESFTLISSHDEYSLWFDLENNYKTDSDVPPHPVCSCGVHMTYSRTHISYLNNVSKRKVLIESLKKALTPESVCLCLNGGSLIGLVAAKMGAKHVTYIEPGITASKLLNELIHYNGLSNVVSVVSDIEKVSKMNLDNIDLVIGDPHFNSAILPWDNLRIGYLVAKMDLLMNPKLKILPLKCSIWVMPVEFLNLHKIKIPLATYNNINFDLFDNLIKDSRTKADDEIESQPLWEYPCVCKMVPVHIGDIYFNTLNYNDKFTGKIQCESEETYNGFVFWLDWHFSLDNTSIITTGPISVPEINKIVTWDPHIRQAVKILDENKSYCPGNELQFSFGYNLEQGIVNANVDIV